MDTSPLVTEDIEAGAAFLKRLHAFRPVKAACWLHQAEDKERYLYVALDGLTTENIREAYDEVRRITNVLKDQYYIDPFRVNLIRPDEPIAQSVLEIYRRYPGRLPPRFNGHVFDMLPVVEGYVYPRFAAEVERC